MSIKIKKINFNNKNDSRILESALSNWFKDPKELNLVEPRLHYPFNLKRSQPDGNNYEGKCNRLRMEEVIDSLYTESLSTVQPDE